MSEVTTKLLDYASRIGGENPPVIKTLGIIKKEGVEYDIAAAIKKITQIQIEIRVQITGHHVFENYEVISAEIEGIPFKFLYKTARNPRVGEMFALDIVYVED